MIHSFSAADPTDPQTIAGRWLSQGAFTYFGAVNEPFLHAFRVPGLVAELVAAEVPLVAAFRQGESETFGFPWRLCYLGDPLYRLQNATITPGDRHGPNKGGQPGNGSRIDPSDWRKIAPDYASWPVAAISSLPARQGQPRQGRVFDSENERFRWYLDASIEEAAGQPGHGAVPLRDGVSSLASPGAGAVGGWQAVLLEAPRSARAGVAAVL